jgi:hypothetical protein
MRRLTILLAAGAISASALGANPAGATGTGATGTSGPFHPFAAGTGLPIEGHARMIRTADGKTVVTVHIEGLAPDATYTVHVHDGDCATNATGGGHYKFATPVVGGAGPGSNEIWPGPVVATSGGVANDRTVVDASAGPSASSVVVHRSGPTPNKIACADLT